MDHLDGLWEAAKPDEIWTYMATKVRSKKEMEQMIKAALKARENGTEYTFTVVNNENQVIGSTRFLDISHDIKVRKLVRHGITQMCGEQK